MAQIDISSQIILYLIKHPPRNTEDVNAAKRHFLRFNKSAHFPSSPDLIKAYHKLLVKNKLSASLTLKKLLIKRAVRTLSGVAVVTVLTKPFPCPGQCVFCPNEKKMPKSYISDEPAAARALALNFDPFEQVARRVKTLIENGHPADKIELIVKGGTWNAYPLDYQYWFILRCFEAANHKIEKLKIERLKIDGLKKRMVAAQRKNETAKHRIIGLTLETRPDQIDEHNLCSMRELGCTRVELGVQTIDDKILKLVKRGHTAEEIKKATQLLKNRGFKVDYHLMPQLPGSTPKKDLEMMKEIFKNPAYRPDMIKIYPCTTVENSELFEWLKKKKYKPYGTRALIDIIKKFKTIVPRYVRISRLIRDIPSHHIKAGNTVTNLRQVIQKEMAEEGTRCKCLRCREIGHFPLSKGERKGVCRPLRLRSPKLFIDKYKASGGTEYFLSFEDAKRQCVFAFCRLRLDKKGIYPAFIRELHTYGQSLEIGKKGKKDSQHKGLGKKLMVEAEKICRTKKITALAVISGVGVRDYYRHLGYCLENGPACNALACEAGGYMVKRFR